MLPLVSILVPIYGVEKYISRCAHSLFGQTYEKIEFIFVNDCTKDSSIQILKSVIDNYPQRKKSIKIISHESNRGLGAARNTAVLESLGDFLLVVDSDDWLELDAVEKLVNKQIETDADLVRGNFVVEFSHSAEIVKIPQFDSVKEYCIACLTKLIPINIWGQLIKRDLYIDNNVCVEEGCNMAEDYQVTPLLVYYSKTVAWEDSPLYHYDCSNMSSYTHAMKETNMTQILHSHELLKSFFVDKGREYVDALSVAQAQIVSENIVSCCRSSLFGSFFESQLKLAANVLPEFYSPIKKNYKIVFKFIQWPTLLRMIVFCGDLMLALKRFIKGGK